MQAERDQLLKNYEDLREENSELKLKDSITNTVLGKWRFLSLEIAESGVTQEVAEAKAALYALELKHLTLEFFQGEGHLPLPRQERRHRDFRSIYCHHCSLRR